jgi:hypothetical protein
MSKCYDNPEYDNTYSDVQNTWNQFKSKKETFEDYLQRLKDRRTEDDYKYTDEDFKNYIYYIFDCYEKGMSVYKCLEFMYFAERDMDDQLFNRESKQECTITKIMQMDAKMAYDLLPKQETLEQIDQNNPIRKGSTALVYEQETLEEAAERLNYFVLNGRTPFNNGFKEGAKWQQERSYSEEEVLDIIYKFKQTCPYFIEAWFEQFKKK